MMKASEIMSSELHVVTPDEPVRRAAEIMMREDIGSLPVVDSPLTMHLMGVVTDRDITVRHVAAGDGNDCTVARHMTDRGLVTVHDDDHVHDVMGRMRHHQLRRLPVIDAQHRVVGVVAQADLARHVASDEPRTFEKMMEGISSPQVAAV